MATAMTFASLQTLVADYLERGSSLAVDPIVRANLPTLINNAERRIADDLKVLGFKVPVVSAFTAGVAVYALPDRWRRTASINFGTGTLFNTRVPIYSRSYEFVREFWPNDTVTGQPRYFAPYDFEHFIVAPTPDQGYPFELVYYQLPPLLDEATQTNWITEYQPQLLLFATLLECTEFLKNDERIPVWQGEYQGRVDKLNGNDRGHMTDQGTSRTGA
jgi:hypothetical protein